MAPPKRRSAGRNTTPPPGRDNSVSLSRHNLLTTLLRRKASAVARNPERKISRYKSISYGMFLVAHHDYMTPMAASPATLAAGYLPLGFLVPGFFGSAFNALSAANG